MVKLKKNDIITLNLIYHNGLDSKSHPAIIVSNYSKNIALYKITSQYEKKSDFIKSKYFEIIDWQKSGLRKKSYIDTFKTKYILEGEYTTKLIGTLSERDIERFIRFLTEQNNKN